MRFALKCSAAGSAENAQSLVITVSIMSGYCLCIPECCHLPGRYQDRSGHSWTGQEWIRKSGFPECESLRSPCSGLNCNLVLTTTMPRVKCGLP